MTQTETTVGACCNEAISTVTQYYTGTPGYPNAASAMCGYIAVGGGIYCEDADATILNMAPAPAGPAGLTPTTWIGECSHGNMYVYANCTGPTATSGFATAKAYDATSSGKSATVNCPAGRIAISAGFDCPDGGGQAMINHGGSVSSVTATCKNTGSTTAYAVCAVATDATGL